MLMLEGRKLLKASEVGKILGVTPFRVYQLARAGLLPSVRLGRQIRFSEEQLTDWLRAGGRSLSGGWRHGE